MPLAAAKPASQGGHGCEARSAGAALAWKAMDPEALPATGHASLTRARHEVQRKRSVEPAPPSSKPRGSRWEAPKTGAQEQGGGGLTFPISFAERVARMSGQQGAKLGGTAEQAVFGGGSGNNKKVAVASKWND